MPNFTRENLAGVLLGFQRCLPYLKMKPLVFSLLIATLALSGCASANFSSGVPFDTTKVSSIQKGVTTKAEVVSWFGQPFTKSVSGADGEMWVYIYSTGTSKARSMVFTVDVETTGRMQKLEVLFAGDVVSNHSFTDGGLPGTMSSTVGH